MPDRLSYRAIPETSGLPYRLGRHVHHDPRSKNYPARRLLEPRLIVPRNWGRRVPIYNQGNLGSCTAQAICGAVSTLPFTRAIRGQRTVRSIYHVETMLDPYEGTWPPDDTGSDGLTACKVAEGRGWIRAYAHAFSLDDVLLALQYGPVITGIPWHQGMFTPDPDGLVHITGPVVGGHELCLVGLDVVRQRVLFANSWGPDWGRDGYGSISYDGYAALLADDGDATVPLAKAPT